MLQSTSARKSAAATVFQAGCPPDADHFRTTTSGLATAWIHPASRYLFFFRPDRAAGLTEAARKPDPFKTDRPCPGFAETEAVGCLLAAVGAEDRLERPLHQIGRAHV